MTTLRCYHCGHRFGSRSRILVVDGALTLCPTCGDDPAVHRRIYFACGERHACRDHFSAVATTRGRALQLISGP